MNGHREDEFPTEIGARLMTFLRETNGEFEVADMLGFLNFVAEYGERHPVLRGFVKINEEAVVEHFKRSRKREQATFRRVRITRRWPYNLQYLLRFPVARTLLAS